MSQATRKETEVKMKCCIILIACGVCLLLCSAAQAIDSPQQRRLNHALLAAADICNVEEIRALLKSGANPNVRSRQGRTPLMAIIQCNSSRTITAAALLLEHGADINAVETGFLHDSALSWAAAGLTDLAVFRFLLSRGARVNYRNRWGQTALVLAARYQNWDLVRLLLDHGADPNVRNWNGATPLIYAAGYDRSADLPAVRALIGRHARTNVVDGLGETPLAILAAQGKREAVQWLFDSGADAGFAPPNEPDGNTALHWLAYSWPLNVASGEAGLADYPGTLRLLLSKGGSINARNRYGWTPLMSAVAGSLNTIRQQEDEPDKAARLRAALLDEVRTLLANGADINARSRTFETALTLAGGSAPAVTALLKAAQERQRPPADNMGKELIEAAARGQTERVRALLTVDADVNATDEYGRTPLLAATELGSYYWREIIDHRAQLRSFAETETICQLLLKRGARPNIRDNRGNTALDYASGNQSPACIQLLLDHGGRITRHAGLGTPALCAALQAAQYRVAGQLLARGADARSRSERGEPALFAAIRGGVEPVQMLLEHGADPNVRSPDSSTPLMEAVLRNDPELVDLLLHWGADIDAQDHDGQTALAQAIGRPGMFFFLLDRGADVHAQDKNMGQLARPLHQSIDGPLVFSSSLLIDVIAKGTVQMVQAVLDRGANPNARNPRPALFYALAKPEIAELLIARGANVNARDGETTALMEATQSGYTEAVRLLIRHHADLNARDDKGRSALDIATDAPAVPDRVAIMNLLRSAGAR
jgi:ankyrin repeat protein